MRMLFQSVVTSDMSICLLFLLSCRFVYIHCMMMTTTTTVTLTCYRFYPHSLMLFSIVYVFSNYCVHVDVSRLISIFFFLFAVVTAITHIMLYIDVCFVCILINARTNLLFIDCWRVNIDVWSKFFFSYSN
jgi:hypothetical protein